MRVLAMILCVLVFGASLAHADDKLRVGKAVAGPFDFVPLDIGIQKGFFKAHGVDVEEVDFDGSAKLQQGLGADAIDVGLGSGPELAFVAKGNTDLAIAVFAGAPNSQVLIVRADGPVHTVADLKGKKIGLSTVGSLTDWLVRELSRQQGWGPEGIQGVPLGSESGRTASLRAGTTDGMVIDVATAAKLEKEKIGRIVVQFGTVAPNFIIHAIFATNKAIAEKPDVLKRFLAGWFETINWMRSHKDETVALAAPVMHQEKDIVAMNYDQTMNDFSITGRFDPKALAVLARSFVEMKTLPAEPDMSKLYTEKLLP
ncbi:MAG TPA: ABC transporter substrate-binding protein [Stellaceae bacterium]|jgi:ABC-type nitrate/sulfonate/bicarbonate transport system substrate-binding protein|nr:ABC transporter substrate-binding protein [Stellaceae bacterium]